LRSKQHFIFHIFDLYTRMGQEEMNIVPDSIMEEFNIKIDQVIIITQLLLFKLRVFTLTFFSFLFDTTCFIWFNQSVHEQEYFFYLMIIVKVNRILRFNVCI
jgi:hypothetical protein